MTADLFLNIVLGAMLFGPVVFTIHVNYKEYKNSKKP